MFKYTCVVKISWYGQAADQFQHSDYQFKYLLWCPFFQLNGIKMRQLCLGWMRFLIKSIEEESLRETCQLIFEPGSWLIWWEPKWVHAIEGLLIHIHAEITKKQLNQLMSTTDQKTIKERGFRWSRNKAASRSIWRSFPKRENRWIN